MASEQQKSSMAEPLLEQPLVQPAPEDSKGAWASLLTLIGFVFLTFNSAMTVSSWHRVYGAVSYVAFSYLDLVLLFYCLRMYRKTPLGSLRRDNLRVAMWLLTTMLTIAFLLVLEFWLLSVGLTENSIADFQNVNPCPHQHAYQPAVP
ncbi:hypothetical protein BAE44_0010728 [Dichanthelium oligosanthes]|uniref:Uncharacterized protein n=1 Tax=Dichanthelium oligosanthes TaxID=888268 RepID=A0A1E5VT51_9POAL|nr:hypothetical protein BAE44_0010728 [Dichanthelium oligosanthes]